MVVLKLQDSSEVAKRPLDCLLYHMVGKLPFESHFESLENARLLGFKVPTAIQTYKSIDEVFDFYKPLGRCSPQITL